MDIYKEIPWEEIQPKTRVFIRFDFNVPMENGHITDTSRIDKALPLLQNLLAVQARIIGVSSLGRPVGGIDTNPHLSLEPIVSYVAMKLKKEIIFYPSFDENLNFLIDSLKPHQMIFLENMRFLPEETQTTASFIEKITSCFDIYICEAFASAHRRSATLYALPLALPQTKKFIGPLFRQEIYTIYQFMNQPPNPVAYIFGGGKVADKIPLLQKMLRNIDVILIGGAMAYTFMHRMGQPVGDSKIDTNSFKAVDTILTQAKIWDIPIYLPIDHMVQSTENPQDFSIQETLLTGVRGIDIGPQTQRLFHDIIQKSRTIVWNGPMGVYEMPQGTEGTIAIIDSIAQNPHCISLAGGGDTASAVLQADKESVFTFVSTGGGATLDYLEHGTLPVLEAFLTNP
jgi:phosphoglycerate kinase